MGWFDQLRFTSGLSDRGHFFYTADRLKDATSRKKLLNFAQRADFNISDLSSEVSEVSAEDLPVDARAQLPPGKTFLTAEIKTKHPRYNRDGRVEGNVEFDLEDHESQGTRKFVSLSGPLHHTIEEGSAYGRG